MLISPFSVNLFLLLLCSNNCFIVVLLSNVRSLNFASNFYCLITSFAAVPFLRVFTCFYLFLVCPQLCYCASLYLSKFSLVNFHPDSEMFEDFDVIVQPEKLCHKFVTLKIFHSCPNKISNTLSKFSVSYFSL